MAKTNPLKLQEPLSIDYASKPATKTYKHLRGLAQNNSINTSVGIKEKSCDDETFLSAEDARLAEVLQELLEQMHQQDGIEQLDKNFLDKCLAKLDELIHAQLDVIIHHPCFQQAESLWRSLQYIIDRADFRTNIKVEIINVSKEALAADFLSAVNIAQSGLYQQLCDRRNHTFVQEPITAVIADYDFTAAETDIKLLKNIAEVAAAAHCPFIGNVSQNFFFNNSWHEINSIAELQQWLQKNEYAHWHKFRNNIQAQYIGLALPRFVLRIPYGKNNLIRNFHYTEEIKQQEDLLWGKASFAFAANLLRSFRRNGWLVNIRGERSGGRIDNLPLQIAEQNSLSIREVATYIALSSHKARMLADAGFIPISYTPGDNLVCFPAANSVCLPLTKDNNALHYIDYRLPYLFLMTRLAAYIKVLRQELIGTPKNRMDFENILNQWLQGLITVSNESSRDMLSKQPLREGIIKVKLANDNPSFYQVIIHIKPFFKIDAEDKALSTTVYLPKAVA